MSDYDGADDARRSWALAVEAMRGHAYIDVLPDGSAEIVVHKHNINGHQEFRAPMTRSTLTTLAKHCITALEKMDRS